MMRRDTQQVTRNHYPEQVVLSLQFVVSCQQGLSDLNSGYVPEPRCYGRRAEAEPGARSGRLQDLHGGTLLQRRQVEEPGNSVHIQQVELLSMPGETHRDYRGMRQEVVRFPVLKRDRRQQIVVTDHDVRGSLGCTLESRVEANHVGGREPHCYNFPLKMGNQHSLT